MKKRSYSSSFFFALARTVPTQHETSSHSTRSSHALLDQYSRRILGNSFFFTSCIHQRCNPCDSRYDKCIVVCSSNPIPLFVHFQSPIQFRHVYTVYTPIYIIFWTEMGPSHAYLKMPAYPDSDTEVLFVFRTSDQPQMHQQLLLVLLPQLLCTRAATLLQ